MQNEIVVILGKKGSGKSIMARHYVKDKRRLVVYDPMRQFSDLGIVVESRRDFLEYLIGSYDGKFRIVYQPVFEMASHDIIATEFQWICHSVSCLKEIYFMVDEIDSCLSPRDQENFYFKNMVQRGRHSGISLVTTTIRYTDVQRNLTAQADTIICFHTHEPADTRYFRGYFGAMAEDLPALPPYHFIKYEKGQVTKNDPIRL